MTSSNSHFLLARTVLEKYKKEGDAKAALNQLPNRFKFSIEVRLILPSVILFCIGIELVPNLLFCVDGFKLTSILIFC